jgi:hypothetical protein
MLTLGKNISGPLRLVCKGLTIMNIPIGGNLATNWSGADADVLALTSSISSTNYKRLIGSPVRRLFVWVK